MKNFNRFIIILSFTGIFSIFGTARAAAAADTIRIVRGGEDTVRHREHVLVGTVPAGSKVRINGQPVKVYKTGSFGYRAHLQNGDNTLMIESVRRRNVQTKKLRIFYDPFKPAETGPETTAPAVQDASLLVRTRPGAYLNYGNGSDRLGGAKINFLDKDILLKVTGESGNLYRVRLSDHRYAFIPKEYADKMAEDEEVLIGPCLSGSWSVSNAGRSDRVSISLEARRPYTVREETRPHRLVLDLYGVQCNSNWITQYPGLKAIRDVQFDQIESDILRVIIHLSNRTSWGYAVRYNDNNLVIDIKHRPEKFALRKLVIGVDAGHGGGSSGAVSPAGYKEKDQTLAMAYMLTKMLRRKGARPVMSRTEDTEVSMARRKEIFREHDIDLLVSVHCNAGGDPLTTGGTSTYYRHWTHRDLANAVLVKILEIKGVKCFGLVGNFNFSLNAPTEYPSVLVETLFLSNLWDEEHITDKRFQKKIMKKVVEGLEAYLQFCTEVEGDINGPDNF